MRYVLHPGYIPSKNDADTHWISADRLAYLYGVRINDCVVLGDEWARLNYRELPGDIHLRPRYDGDYSLPTTVDKSPNQPTKCKQCGGSGVIDWVRYDGTEEGCPEQDPCPSCTTPDKPSAD